MQQYEQRRKYLRAEVRRYTTRVQKYECGQHTGRSPSVAAWHVQKCEPMRFCFRVAFQSRELKLQDNLVDRGGSYGLSEFAYFWGSFEFPALTGGAVVVTPARCAVV